MLPEGFINLQNCLINQCLYLFINLTAASLVSIPLLVDIMFISSFFENGTLRQEKLV